MGYFNSGLITELEKEEMIGFLIETENKVKINIVEQEEEKTKQDRPALEEVLPEVSVVSDLSKEQRLENLKNKHGIVVEMVGEVLKELKGEIIKKSNNLWERSVENTKAIAMLLGEEVLKGDKKEQILGRHVFELPFLGKKIHIIHGETDGSNDDMVKVIFDGKEIAKGVIGQIDMDKNLKGGILLGVTDFERAFIHAMKLIKTFKK